MIKRIKNLINFLQQDSKKHDDGSSKNGYYDLIKETLTQTDYFDDTSTTMVRKFLNEKCKRFTFGSKFIKTHYGPLFMENNIDYSFYKVPSSSAKTFYMYNNTLLKVTAAYYKHENLSIQYIKGTLDHKKFIKDVREYNRSQILKDAEYAYFDNFHIRERVGNSNYRDRDNSTDGDALPSNAVCDSDNEYYSTDEFLNCSYNDIIIKSKKGPFESLYYSDEVMNTVEDINQWLKQKEWFIERNLPWKRGILLYGPAGTGKSSLAKALAQQFGLPLNHFYLSTMDDDDFKRAWANSVTNSPCIILLEDFDNVFNKRTPVNKEQNLNFVTLLNTISGVQDSSGVLLIITTNHIENIDEAIGVYTDKKTSSRPGRIDRIVYLGEMDDITRNKLIYKILKDWPDLIEIAAKETKNFTAAQVQEYCIQKALIKLHEKYNG